MPHMSIHKKRIAALASAIGKVRGHPLLSKSTLAALKADDPDWKRTGWASTKYAHSESFVKFSRRIRHPDRWLARLECFDTAGPSLITLADPAAQEALLAELDELNDLWGRMGAHLM